MKKYKILAMFLTLILAFSFGCQKSETAPKKEVLTDYDGTCKMTIVERDSFYYPTLSGTIILSVIPDGLSAEIAGEEFDLEIRSINASNGMYVLGFREEHVFGKLEKKTYSIAINVHWNGKVLQAKNFGTFECDDDYFALHAVSFNPEWGTDASNEDEWMQDSETIVAMDKESNWTPAY